MKIGVIGSGNVGQALAAGFIKHGYDVMIGTRHKEKLSEWKDENDKARIGSFSETASFGDLLVFSVKGSSAIDVMDMVGDENIEGKTIIDTTNPISDDPPTNGVLNFFTSMNGSLMEQLQSKHPKANFVKSFNSIGSSLMVNPDFKEGKPTMFICGNDVKAKSEVKEILDKFGFEVEDMGEAEAARAIEPLCILWCIPGFLNNQWTHAFKLLKK